MSRHRDFRRGFDIDNELSDDVYGRSAEDEYAVSPSTASQYHYKEEQQSLFSFISTPQQVSPSSSSSSSVLPPSAKTKKQRSGEGEGEVEGKAPQRPLVLGYQREKLGRDAVTEAEAVDENYHERVLMENGKAYITSVVGTEFGEADITEALLRCDLSAEIALNELLTQRSLKSPAATTKSTPLISFAPIGSTSTKATGQSKDEDQRGQPSCSSSHTTGVGTESSADVKESGCSATGGLSAQPTLADLIRSTWGSTDADPWRQKKSKPQGSSKSSSSTSQTPSLADLIKQRQEEKKELPNPSKLASSSTSQTPSLADLIKQRQEEKKELPSPSSLTTSSSTSRTPSLADLIKQRQEEKKELPNPSSLTTSSATSRSPSLADLMSGTRVSGSQAPASETLHSRPTQQQQQQQQQPLSGGVAEFLPSSHQRLTNVHSDFAPAEVSIQPATSAAVVIRKVCSFSHCKRPEIDEGIARSFLRDWYGLEGQTKVRPFFFNTPSPDDMVRASRKKTVGF